MKLGILLPLVLTGCVIATPITAPNGKHGFVLTCNGAAGWGGCYAKASEKCPGGYDVVSQNGNTGQVITGTVNNGSGAVIGAPVAYRSLVVACH